MADNKDDRGGRDRATVSGDEDYEVEFFAKRHNITPAEARELIEKHGNNREALNAAAADLGKHGS